MKTQVKHFQTMDKVLKIKPIKLTKQEKQLLDAICNHTIMVTMGKMEEMFEEWEKN